MTRLWPHLRLTELSEQLQRESTPEPVVSTVEVEVTETQSIGGSESLRYSPLVDAPTLPPAVRETRRTRGLKTQVPLVEWGTDLPSGIL
jgi:hypothetical protein